MAENLKEKNHDKVSHLMAGLSQGDECAGRNGKMRRRIKKGSKEK
jgi:hypothetical protein